MVSSQFGAFHFGARQFDVCQFGAFHFGAFPIFVPNCTEVFSTYASLARISFCPYVDRVCEYGV